MQASELVPLLKRVRLVGEDKWIARCPAHEDRSPSLSFQQSGERILIHCFAGCSLDSIGAALGVRSQEWFSDHEDQSATAREHRQTLLEIREMRRVIYREDLRRIGDELRRRDLAKIAITDAVQRGYLTETEAWERLGPLYAGYQELEDRFHELLRYA